MAAVLFSKQAIAALLMTLYVVATARPCEARPPWLDPDSGVFTESADCHTDDELLDLCQRCAKLTKSMKAYPSCCSTDFIARRWCSDYVYFGRGEFDLHHNSTS